MTAKQLAVSEKMPEYLMAAISQSNAGNEEVGTEDLVIPRVGIIQALSPQRKKNDPAYIAGAEEGMIFNNVTSELYGEVVNVVPVYFKKDYLLWKDRKAGGGFRGAYPTIEDANAARSTMDDADAIEISDTAQHFVIIVREDGSMDEAVISMSRSQMKVSRKWNSIIRMAGGPRFSRVYALSSVEETNANGDSYLNWGIKQVGYPSQEVFDRAKHLYEVVSSGAATAQHDRVEEDADSEDY
jgi:hypothetical protein